MSKNNWAKLFIPFEVFFLSEFKISNTTWERERERERESKWESEWMRERVSEWEKESV